MDLANFNSRSGDTKKDNRPDKARSESSIQSCNGTQENLSKLEKLRIPVICGIQGGLSGGQNMATCRLRFATKDAFFCIQEVNIGMAADIGTHKPC